MWIHTIRWIHSLYEFIQFIWIHANMWIRTSYEFTLLCEFIHHTNSCHHVNSYIRWIQVIMWIHTSDEFTTLCEFIQSNEFTYYVNSYNQTNSRHYVNSYIKWIHMFEFTLLCEFTQTDEFTCMNSCSFINLSGIPSAPREVLYSQDRELLLDLTLSKSKLDITHAYSYTRSSVSQKK